MGDIRLAYLLVAHTNPDQVNTFIKQVLDYGDSEVFLHIDKKNEVMKERIIHSNRVHVYSEYEVRWGSFEIVKAAYFLMNKAIDSKHHFTHAYFGSGQDLLVKKGMYEYLSENSDKTFLRIVREITNKNRQSARYRIKWPKKLMKRDDWSFSRFIRIFYQLLCCVGIVMHPNKHILKENVKFYEGRTWFIAPISVIEYISNYINEHKDYVDFWEDSLASDLMFFQTIIMNSKYKDKVQDELMFVHFGNSIGTMNHPIDISIEDDETIERGDYFCARKFNYNDKKTYDYYLKKVQ